MVSAERGQHEQAHGAFGGEYAEAHGGDAGEIRPVHGGDAAHHEEGQDDENKASAHVGSPRKNSSLCEPARLRGCQRRCRIDVRPLWQTAASAQS